MVERHSALAEHYRTGRFGAGETPGVTFAERRGLEIVQVAAFPGDLVAVSSGLQAACGLAAPSAEQSAASGGIALLSIGPERWMAVAPEGTGLPAKLAEAFAALPAVAVTDLSHSRTVIRLQGPGVRALLAKDTPLDFDPAAFPAGRASSSRFGHVVVTLHAVEEQVFDLYAFRSFGLALWEELTDQAGDLGYEVVEPLTA